MFRSYLYGRRGAQRVRGAPARDVVILCYHRVSDALRDNVTIGVAQFAMQIAFLKANCNLVSLRAIIEQDLADAPHPLVAITFDDGYLDNYENAFPILAEHGASATFFVSTDHITSKCLRP